MNDIILFLGLEDESIKIIDVMVETEQKKGSKRLL